MADFPTKESELKFCKQDFRDLSVPDNLLNLWIYNYFGKHKPCFSCKTHSKYSEEVLKEEWRDGWGDFDIVIGKIKNCDISLINLNNYSSEMTKWEILDELIKKNKENK